MSRGVLFSDTKVQPFRGNYKPKTLISYVPDMHYFRDISNNERENAL